MTILVRGKWVIPDADNDVINDGAVAVEDGKITAGQQLC